MMKKLITIILCGVMALSLVACGGGDSAGSSNSDNGGNVGTTNESNDNKNDKENKKLSRRHQKPYSMATE